MFNQALRAALLDSTVFDDISDEPESMFRSMAVVLLGALGFGLGWWSIFRTDAADDQRDVHALDAEGDTGVEAA